MRWGVTGQTTRSVTRLRGYELSSVINQFLLFMIDSDHSRIEMGVQSHPITLQE